MTCQSFNYILAVIFIGGENCLKALIIFITNLYQVHPRFRIILWWCTDCKSKCKSSHHIFTAMTAMKPLCLFKVKIYRNNLVSSWKSLYTMEHIQSDMPWHTTNISGPKIFLYHTLLKQLAYSETFTPDIWHCLTIKVLSYL